MKENIVFDTGQNKGAALSINGHSFFQPTKFLRMNKIFHKEGVVQKKKRTMAEEQTNKLEGIEE